MMTRLVFAVIMPTTLGTESIHRSTSENREPCNHVHVSTTFLDDLMIQMGTHDTPDDPGYPSQKHGAARASSPTEPLRRSEEGKHLELMMIMMVINIMIIIIMIAILIVMINIMIA